MAIDPATRASLEIERSPARRARRLAAGRHRPHRDRARRAPAGGAAGAAAAVDPTAIDARLDAVDWLLRAPRACARSCARR